MDIWLIDLLRGALTRFTFDPAVDQIPMLSKDGTRIAFPSDRNGSRNLYLKPSTAVGEEEG